MEPEIKLSAEQSIELITTMIRAAKGRVQRNSFYFLLWGWVVAVAYVGVFILSKAGVEQPYLIWLITIPAWIVTLLRMMRRDAAPEAKSHFDSISMWLWLAFGLMICTFVLFGSRINYQLNPVILTCTALPTFLSGVIVRFKPLKIGGIIFWLGGIACFLVSFDVQPLIGGLTVIGGYLIPGYMLKRKSD